MDYISFFFNSVEGRECRLKGDRRLSECLVKREKFAVVAGT